MASICMEIKENHTYFLNAMAGLCLWKTTLTESLLYRQSIARRTSCMDCCPWDPNPGRHHGDQPPPSPSVPATPVLTHKQDSTVTNHQTGFTEHDRHQCHVPEQNCPLQNK
jgi:hypothetical protein